MSRLDLPLRVSPQKKISQRNRVVMVFCVSGQKRTLNA
jgi:hypothetical protein